MSFFSFFRDLGAPMPTPLNQPERTELARHEALIERTVTSYRDSGAALVAIRDKQLYRETHPSFEAYVTERWKMSVQHANRIIAAAAVAANLEPAGSLLPNARQARELASLPKAEQLDAWQEAQQLAGDDDLATFHVAEAVAKRKPKSKRKSAKPITFRVPGASITITPNKAFTTPEAALTAALDQLRTRNAA